MYQTTKLMKKSRTRDIKEEKVISFLVFCWKNARKFHLIVCDEPWNFFLLGQNAIKMSEKEEDGTDFLI